jgi:uncharacterized protein YgbK (DUF1537 family)
VNRQPIIVLDDDPTGSQTVHGCLLLTRWDTATLRAALADEVPLFFILTNTRALPAAQAAAVTREVCRHLKDALAGSGLQPLFVSRSDSTLRGHYPVETDVIAEELGPFDAHFIVPAFFEGGRFTRGGTHYLRESGRELPVHETEFARDSVFGYSHSYLPDYVAEKTGGRITAGAVTVLDGTAQATGLEQRLLALGGNACAVVDAEDQPQLNRFADAVRTAAAQGRRFLFRSAASLITALARLPPQPLAAVELGRSALNPGGAVIVGSHVPKSTRQLQALLAQPGTEGIELVLSRLHEAGAALAAAAGERAAASHAAGRTPVIYTSRQELAFPSQAQRLAFGEQVSALLMDIVRALPPSLGYLIAKGGITSNDTLSTGLALPAARLLGQVLPGVSVVRCPPQHPRHPGMPVVIFPGNVGGDDALAAVYQRFSML